MACALTLCSLYIPKIGHTPPIIPYYKCPYSAQSPPISMLFITLNTYNYSLKPPRISTRVADSTPKPAANCLTLQLSLLHSRATARVSALCTMGLLAKLASSRRERKQKCSFKPLPGGANGSSANPETVSRNRRRQRLSPLQAALERARCRKANQISRRIQKIKEEEDWEKASEVEKEAALKTIRDEEQDYYEKHRIEVFKQYETEFEAKASPTAPPGPATPKEGNQCPAPIPTTLGSRPRLGLDDSDDQDKDADDEDGRDYEDDEDGEDYAYDEGDEDDEYDDSEEGDDEERKIVDEGDPEAEEVTDVGSDEDSPGEMAGHMQSLRERNLELQNSWQKMIEAIEQSAARA